MEPRLRGHCFCVIVFVVGTFREGRQEVRGKAASARAPGRTDPPKVADDCQTRLSARQHAAASTRGGFGSKKGGFQTLMKLSGQLPMGFAVPPQANADPRFKLDLSC